MGCPSFQQTIFNYNTVWVYSRSSDELASDLSSNLAGGCTQIKEQIQIRKYRKSKKNPILEPESQGDSVTLFFLQTNMLGGRNKILTGALREVVSSINQRSLVSN